MSLLCSMAVDTDLEGHGPPELLGGSDGLGGCAYQARRRLPGHLRFDVFPDFVLGHRDTGTQIGFEEAAVWRLSLLLRCN